jgi:hypothetical protein
MAQDKYKGLDHYEDLGDQEAESQRFHDEFEAPPTPHLQKGVYSDDRALGGHWGVEAHNRGGDCLGDCGAEEQSERGAESLADLARATRSAERS